MFRNLIRLFASGSTRSKVRLRRAFRPDLETLEGRCAPAVLTVNTTLDSNSATDTTLSLREAILDINGTLGRTLTTAQQQQVTGTLGSSDTIAFSLPTGPQTITLTGGALDIQKAVSVNGPATTNLTINGNNQDRVLIIGTDYTQNLGLQAAISNLTFTGGLATATGKTYGGGLLNFGTLSVTGCTFWGNTAAGSGGGAIYNKGALTLSNCTVSGNSENSGPGAGLQNASSSTVTIANCLFSGNTATAAYGAGLANSGTMTINTTTFSNNTSSSSAGAIYNNSSATMTVTACTFSNNSASSSGGGIRSSGTLTIINSTLYGNTAGAQGGGINSGAAMTLTNCTLSANRTTSGSATNGGGLYVSVAAKVNNTIVAGNFQGASPSATASDIGGTLDATSAFNLIGIGGSGGLSNGVSGNQVGLTNLGLGALANNGGPTQTILLSSGSPALNQGNNANVPLGGTDQRGLSRIVNTTVDIGAVEMQMSSTAPINQTAPRTAATLFTLGSFADAASAAGPWTVTVNWGDASANTVFTANAQGPLAAQLHTYASAGNFTVVQSVADAGNEQSQASFQVNVTNGPVATSFAATGITSPTTAGVAKTITVTVKDGNGNLFPGYVGTVHFTSSDAQAGLANNYTFVSADNGVQTFSVTLKTAGTQSVSVTDTVVSSLTGAQTGIAVTAADASTFALAGFPSPRTAGVAGNVTISSKDAFGNVATGYTGTVQLTSSDGQAGLPSNYTFVSGDNGVHALSATLKTSGVQSLAATDSATTSITGSQSGIIVNAAAATTMALTGFPSPLAAGLPGNFTITARDAFSNAATGYTGTVHFTSDDPQATLPVNYTFVSADNGVHTFSATLKTLAITALSATDTVNSSLTASQTGIVVNAATVSTFTVAGFSSPTTAGAVGNFTVTAKDAFGNIATGYTGTVHITSSDSLAGLPGNFTFVSGDNGVHIFSATLTTAGSQSLTATDITTSSITGTQTGIVVNAASASALTIAGFPSPIGSGVAENFTVTAKDAFGNTANSYTGDIGFTSSDGSAVLPGIYTFVSGDNGVHTFSATLKSLGTQSLTATDSVTSSITGAQTGIVVNPAPATTFTVAGIPSPTTAGVVSTVTVTAKDADGNAATGYTGTVHLTSSDAQAVLPGNYTFVTGDNGVHTFSVTLQTAGSQSLTATDIANSSLTGSQTSIAVVAASASAFTVIGFPSPTTAGVVGNVTITAKDAFGNTATDYSGTVGLTSSDGQAGLPANYTFVSGEGGVHALSATLKTAGAQSLTATDIVTSSITGSQTGITVNAAPASTFALTGFPSPVTAGVAGNVTVTARDAFGNLASSYTGIVHFTSNDAQAVLPTNYTFVSGEGGVHTFSATLKTAGNGSLTAADTVTSSLSATQSSITVNPAAASVFAVAGFPAPTTAGVAGNVTITAKDAFGNTATGYTGTVHLTSSDAQAGLPANYTFVSGDNGVHALSATLKTAGTQALAVTDMVTTSITGAQTGIVVSPASASTLTVAGFPSPIGAGVAGNVTVTAKDAFGNTASGSAGTVHFTSSDGQAVLPGNYTFVGADNGVHTFSATLKSVGTQSITATDTLTSSITGAQTGIVVNPAGATTFVVAGIVSPTTAGVVRTVTVTAKDANGNTVTSYTGTVHFTSSDAQAALPANYTFVSADNGVHTFNVTLKTSATQSVTATDTVTSSLTGSQTGIVVVAASTSTFTVTGFPSTATAGVAGNVTVTAKDAFGNTAISYLGTVRVTSSDAQAVLAANYAFVSGDNGVHTFSVTLKTAATQSITATDNATSSITGVQSGIIVKAAAATTYTVAGFPSPINSGVAGNVTVTAKDAFGNVATGYLGTVRITGSDAQAVLPANYAFVSGDSGVHSFSVTLKTAGTQSITATDTVASSITGSQTGIVVNSAGQTTITVNSLADNTTADNVLTLREAILVVNNTLGRSLTAGEQAQVSGTAATKVIQFNIPSGAQTVTLTGGALNVTAPVSINGPGSANLTLSANNASRVFFVGQSSSQNLGLVVSISGLTVAHSQDQYGGGLFNAGTLTLSNVAFTNNTATASGGGGVYNNGALTLNNCTFTSNTSIPNGSGATAGGGLLNLGAGTVTATNCTFSGNVAGGTGAAAGQGGGIANSGTMTISGTTLTGNTATFGGGGIYSGTGSLTLTNCTLSNNTVLANAVTPPQGGGLLNEIPATVILTGCTFSGNSAQGTGQGGGVFNSGGTLTVNGCSFTSNTAASFGGAYYAPNAGGSNPVTITNTTFTNNSTAASGGAIANLASMAVSGCTLSGNTSTSSGGGIYNASSITLTGTTITGSSCGPSAVGGGMFNNTGASVTFTDCTVSNNSAGGSGSTASAGGGLYAYGTVNMTRTTFSNNVAASDAGAIYSNNILVINSCNLINNTSTATAGAIYVKGSFTMTGSNVSGNTSGANAGGIEVTGATVANISNSTIANNTASSSGGGLINFNSPTVLTNVTVTGNRVIFGSGGSYGGGLRGSTPLTLQNCIVAGNFRDAAPSTTAADTSGTYTPDSSYNMIGTGGAGGLVNGTNNNQVGVANPGLGALTFGVGPVATIPLLGGSPAFNRGSNAFVTAGATDERGFPRIAYGTVDIGAFESQMSSTAPANQTATQGVSKVFNLGSFADATAATGPWTVEINWGDGTANTIFTVPASGALPTQSHAFALSGTRTVGVSVTNGTADASQATFQVSVTPSTAVSFVVSGFPSLVVTGIANTFNVRAVDANGLTANAYRGTVHFTSTDSTATLPSNYTFTAADNGVHTFTATLRNLGIQSITAKDTVTATMTGTQSGIQVNSASPAVLTVNSTADNTTADSSLTLREAIAINNGNLGRALTAAEQLQLAGTLGASNTISFGLPTGPQTIALTAGALNLTTNVTISGPGAANLTINANNLNRVLLVGIDWAPNASLVVAIGGLTISGGNAVYGGGLLNFGTLTLNNCVFSGNTAGSTGGGAIYNAGNLTVTSSTFSANSCASSSGAGIMNYSAATLTVTNCTFTGNNANTGSSGAGIANTGSATVTGSTFSSNNANSNGGGIFNSSSGTMTINTSTFANNACGADGGGVDNDGNLTANYCTFSGNTSNSEGGGVGNNASTINLTGCTIYGNTAVSDGGGFNTNGGSATVVNTTITANRVTTGTNSIYGGGFYATVAVTLRNTIVAGNFQGASPSTTANDIAGSVDATSANNLIGIGGSGGLVNGTNGNLVGVANPGLGTLANNGGPTQTVALLAGSPALNHGNNSFVVSGTTDQRGLTRIVGGTVDIGAFETQLTVTSPGNQNATHNVSANINLGSFTDANNSASPWSVTVNWGDSSSNTTFTANSQGSLGTKAHTYTTAGTYTVTVTVTDANHDSILMTFTVTVI